MLNESASTNQDEVKTLVFRFCRAVGKVSERGEERQMDDLNASAPAAKSTTTSTGKWGKLATPVWLVGILILLALTFLGGFYLPLENANRELGAQVDNLSGQYRQAISGYEKVHGDLATVRKENAERGVALGEISRAESSAKDALAALHEQIKNDLEPLTKTKLVSVDTDPDSVRITIDALYLVYPHKTFVHARGADMLCKVSKAIPKGTGRATEVVAHANGDKPASSILEKQFPSSWQLSAVMASEVASELTKCGIAGTDLRAVGAAHFDGEASRARKSAARFEIYVYPELKAVEGPAARAD